MTSDTSPRGSITINREGAAGTAPSVVLPEGTDPRAPLLHGFAGSVLIAAGSLGVGWLAPASLLARVPVVAGIRTEPVSVALCVLMLVAGSMMLLRGWLWLGRCLGQGLPDREATVRSAIIAWGAPLMLAFPLFSRDIYSYIGQGRLVAEGLNPYEVGISALPNYYQLGGDTMWSEALTPYGPFILWLQALVVTVAQTQPDVCVFLFRCLAMIGVLLCTVYIPRIADLFGVSRDRALWLAAANPLFLTNFIASGHNDSLMLGLALAGLYFGLRRRFVLAVLLITLSIAVKPFTAFFLPFLGLMWAGPHAGWREKMIRWALVACTAAGLLWLMGVPNSLGFGWIGGLSAPGSTWAWYTPTGFLSLVAGLVTGATGLGTDFLTDTIFTAGKAVALGVCAWSVLRGSYSQLVQRLTISLAAVVVLAPMIQAWYVVWLIPLFAVTGAIGSFNRTRNLSLVITFFTVYAVSDQIDIYPYLLPGYDGSEQDLFRQVAALTALALALHQIFRDPATRPVYKNVQPSPQLLSSPGGGTSWGS
jgi:alpha-1,6-mannosyltransferase